MEPVNLVVVGLSASFEDVWDELAAGVGARARKVALDETWNASASAAVVVAAGGAEGAVVDWLESAPLTPDCPCFVVGAEADHRTAAKIVAAGAKVTSRCRRTWRFSATPSRRPWICFAVGASGTREKLKLRRRRRSGRSSVTVQPFGRC